jgi:NAD(P)-dependent dehydrogenase (short-subunit alcohol dehydrogenase family)
MSKAIVWGANGSIGQALTTELVEQGWQVIAVSRHGHDVPGALLTLPADVTKKQAVEAAVRSASLEFGDVDLMIYAAGDITSSRVKQMSPAAWDDIIGANLNGAFLCTHSSLPLLADDAALIYIGAVSERLRLPGLSAYAAAKAGLEAFADSLRKEERKRQILVVRPGAVATPFWDKVPMKLPKDAASAQKVSKRIVEAYNEGMSGVLDLT